MARVTDVAMLFVRCAGGISHHPDESVSAGRRGPGDRGGDAGWRRVRSDRAPRDGRDAVGPCRPTSASSTARSRPSRPSCRARAHELDARRAARLPGRPGPARALQRAGPHALGRPGRPARRARRGRLHGVLRHAAELVAAGDRRRGVRRQAAGRPRRRSCVDYGLWGGLVPGNLDRLEELAERGVIGFKAFMSNCGIDEFVHADDVTLYEGMAIAARLGLARRRARRERRADRAPDRARAPRDCHGLAADRRRGRGDRPRDRCSPRTRAARCTSSTSPARAASRWSPRRAPRGVDVTCETCPHYLWLSQHDVETLGAVAKCAPPVRPDAERARAVAAAAAPARSTCSPPTTRPRRPTLKAGASPTPGAGSRAARRTLELLLTRATLRSEHRGAADRGRRRRALRHRAQGPDRGRRRRRPRADRPRRRATRSPPRTCATATRSRPRSGAACARA